MVIDPYAVASNFTILQPLFDSYFTDQLYSEGIYPVVTNGSVDFYVTAANKSCHSFAGDVCSAVFCGNAICGSSTFSAPFSAIGNGTLESAFLTGNNVTHEAITRLNALRYATIKAGGDISQIENSIASEFNTMIDTTYIQKRYGSSVGNMIDERILQDPALSGLDYMLRTRDTQGAISLLDKYFAENYNFSSVYDSNDIYSAINNKQIGPMQYTEIMDTIMQKYGLENQIFDFMNKSGILNSTLNSEAMEQALEEIAKHPEWLEQIKKSMDRYDPKMFDNLMSKVLEETFKNKDILKKYMDVMSDMLSNEKMRDTFLKASAQAIRKMQASGELDKLLDGIKDINLQEKIMDEMKKSAPSMLDRLLDEIKSNIEWKYVLPIIGLIVIAAVSLRTGL